MADYAHGAEVYRRLVAPLTADLRRVVAHYAITGLFTEHPDEATIYAYRVERLDETRRDGSGTALRVAHVRVESVVTGETREVMYALAPRRRPRRLLRAAGLGGPGGLRPR